jgi:hypothetical protein
VKYGRVQGGDLDWSLPGNAVHGDDLPRNGDRPRPLPGDGPVKFRTTLAG